MFITYTNVFLLWILYYIVHETSVTYIVEISSCLLLNAVIFPLNYIL